MKDLCHDCHGTGKDADSVAAANYPDHCFNCGGSGHEPEWSEEEDEAESQR